MGAGQCLDRLHFLQTWMMAEKPSLGPMLGTLNFSRCWDEELPASPTCLLSVVDLTETHHSGCSHQLRDRSAEYIRAKVMCELEYSRYANEVHKASYHGHRAAWRNLRAATAHSRISLMLGPQRTWKKTEAPLAASPLACLAVNVQSEEPLYG